MPANIPRRVRWLAFTGWMVVPIAVAWAAVTWWGLPFVWSGPLWLVVAFAYMAIYFAWVRRVTSSGGSRS